MRHSRIIVLLAIALTLSAEPARAYVGPGTGLSAIGSFLALVAAVIVGILGFLWYPLKRLLRRRTSSQD